MGLKFLFQISINTLKLHITPTVIVLAVLPCAVNTTVEVELIYFTHFCFVSHFKIGLSSFAANCVCVFVQHGAEHVPSHVT